MYLWYMKTPLHNYYYCPTQQYDCPYSQKLYMGKIMNIHDIAEYASRLGWEYEILLLIILRAYQNDGDAGVMSMFYEMTDRRIDNIRRGHYIMMYYI